MLRKKNEELSKRNEELEKLASENAQLKKRLEVLESNPKEADRKMAESDDSDFQDDEVVEPGSASAQDHDSESSSARIETSLLHNASPPTPDTSEEQVDSSAPANKWACTSYLLNRALKLAFEELEEGEDRPDFMHRMVAEYGDKSSGKRKRVVTECDEDRVVLARLKGGQECKVCMDRLKAENPDHSYKVRRSNAGRSRMGVDCVINLALPEHDRNRLKIRAIAHIAGQCKHPLIRQSGSILMARALPVTSDYVEVVLLLRRAMNHMFKPNIFALMCCNASISLVRHVVTNIIKSTVVPPSRPTPLDSS
eukprot:scaffold5634_cov116-Skeletonema_dohrnii-CCMP3373.AAC.6